MSAIRTAHGRLDGLAPPIARAEYDALVADGLFANERIELLRGLLVRMSPQDPPHAGAVDNLADQLRRALGARARVRVHAPLALGDDSEPEPDVAVVAPGDYRHAHPTSAFLVVEVAWSSLRRDRGIKAAVYAGAGVAEYSIVDLRRRTVEVLAEPVAGRYRARARAGAGEILRPRAFPDVAVAVDNLLP